MKKGILVTLMLIIWVSGAILAQDDVYKVVEKMPQYPGCENVSDADLSQECANKKMMAYLAENIKYPKESVGAGIEGTGVVEFVVSKTGEIRDVHVLRGLSDEIDKEMVRVVSEMPDWVPGVQRGSNVNVLMKLPIQFKLPRVKEIKPEKKMKQKKVLKEIDN